MTKHSPPKSTRSPYAVSASFDIDLIGAVAFTAMWVATALFALL